MGTRLVFVVENRIQTVVGGGDRLVHSSKYNNMLLLGLGKTLDG